VPRAFPCALLHSSSADRCWRSARQVKYARTRKTAAQQTEQKWQHRVPGKSIQCRSGSLQRRHQPQRPAACFPSRGLARGSRAARFQRPWYPRAPPKKTFTALLQGLSCLAVHQHPDPVHGRLRRWLPCFQIMCWSVLFGCASMAVQPSTIQLTRSSNTIMRKRSFRCRPSAAQAASKAGPFSCNPTADARVILAG